MRTARFEAVHVSVSVVTTRCYSGGGGVTLPEQVWSNHQRSVAGRSPGSTPPDLSGGTLRYNLSHDAFDVASPPLYCNVMR